MLKTYRDEAIVLRTHKLGEADRIITLLTAEHGLVRAVAKGVRRTSSKFGSRLEPFGVIDVQLAKGRTLDTITQVEVINAHGDNIAAHYELFTRASVMAETAEKLTQDSDESARNQYLLLLGALFALAHVRHDPTLILTSYLLRALAIAGWAPSFSDCAVCGAVGPHVAFSLHEGGAVCETCRPPGCTTPSPQAMQLMGELLSGDWQQADHCADFARDEAYRLVTTYAQWHMERRIKSLGVVERNNR